MVIKKKMPRLAALTLSVIMTFLAAVSLHPATASAEGQKAEKLKATFAYEGFGSQKNINDGDNSTFATGSSKSTVAVMTDKSIGFIYVSFNHAPGEWTLASGGKSLKCGENGFIHEYVDVKGNFGDVTVLSLSFPAGAEIDAVTVYGAGEIPDDVQVWQPPCEKADILLLSAHTDDDQLYFAGLIPYYVTVRGAAVQVAYFTEHLKENYRWHERLNGLWTAGMKNYPVISAFPDAYSSSASGAYTNFKTAGFSEDRVVGWVAEQIRRFRPQVTVTHDFKGEYGHGQHMAAVDAMIKAVPLAADTSKEIGGYGAFEVLKTYIHVYDKNPIVIDAYDTPFEQLGGLTPFAVSQQAFLCHKSQLKWTDLTRWMFGINYPQTYPESIKIKKASQITETPPQKFGLYMKADRIPADTAKNDFLENIVIYSAMAPVTTEPQTEEVTTVPEPPITTVPSDETEPDVTAEDTSQDTSAITDETVVNTPDAITTASPEADTSPSQGGNDGKKAGTVILGIFLIVIIVIIAGFAIYLTVDRRKH